MDIPALTLDQLLFGGVLPTFVRVLFAATLHACVTCPLCEAFMGDFGSVPPCGSTIYHVASLSAISHFRLVGREGLSSLSLCRLLFYLLLDDFRQPEIGTALGIRLRCIPPSGCFKYVYLLMMAFSRCV